MAEIAPEPLASAAIPNLIFCTLRPCLIAVVRPSVSLLPPALTGADLDGSQAILFGCGRLLPLHRPKEEFFNGPLKE